MNFFYAYLMGAMFMYGVSFGMEAESVKLGNPPNPTAPIACAAIAPVCAGMIVSKKYIMR